MAEQAELMLTDSGGFINAVCMIRSGGNLVYFNAGQLKRQSDSLATLIVRIKEAMPEETTNIWAGMADPLAAAANPIAEQRFRESMARTIEKGSQLYSALATNGLGDILGRLDEMPDGSHLRVLTDCAFLPWEIFHREPFDRDAAALKGLQAPDGRRLWGYRFSTECNMLEAGGGAVNWAPLLADHAAGPPFVSINLDSSIEQVQIKEGRKFLPIEHHKKFCADYLAGPKAGEVYESPKEIFDQLTSKEPRATFLYLYCHGSNTDPYKPQGEEVLDLGEKALIGPHAIESEQYEYGRAPVIFLNSCTSGQPSPLSFSSFHSVFRRKKALGLIGTAIQIPITFGAAFGCELLRRHYVEGLTLGAAIFRLRRELVDKGNPLALFYSLQCPAEVPPPGLQPATEEGEASA